MTEGDVEKPPPYDTVKVDNYVNGKLEEEMKDDKGKKKKKDKEEEEEEEEKKNEVKPVSVFTLVG